MRRLRESGRSVTRTSSVSDARRSGRALLAFERLQHGFAQVGRRICLHQRIDQSRSLGICLAATLNVGMTDLTGRQFQHTAGHRPDTLLPTDGDERTAYDAYVAKGA